jgi:hypothetical protein
MPKVVVVMLLPLLPDENNKNDADDDKDGTQWAVFLRASIGSICCTRPNTRVLRLWRLCMMIVPMSEPTSMLVQLQLPTSFDADACGRAYANFISKDGRCRQEDTGGAGECACEGMNQGKGWKN